MRSHACMVDPSTCDAQVLFFGGKPLTRVQEQVIWCRNEGDWVNFRTWIYFNYLSFEIHSLRLVDVPASEHTNIHTGKQLWESVLRCRNEGYMADFMNWLKLGACSPIFWALLKFNTFGDGVCCVAVRARAMHRSWRTCRNTFSTMCGAHPANTPATKYYHYLLSWESGLSILPNGEYEKYTEVPPSTIFQTFGFYRTRCERINRNNFCREGNTVLQSTICVVCPHVWILLNGVCQNQSSIRQ